VLQPQGQKLDTALQVDKEENLPLFIMSYNKWWKMEAPQIY
jgi:hypothetical protein